MKGRYRNEQSGRVLSFLSVFSSPRRVSRKTVVDHNHNCCPRRKSMRPFRLDHSVIDSTPHENRRSNLFWGMLREISNPLEIFASLNIGSRIRDRLLPTSHFLLQHGAPNPLLYLPDKNSLTSVIQRDTTRCPRESRMTCNNWVKILYLGKEVHRTEFWETTVLRSENDMRPQ